MAKSLLIRETLKKDNAVQSQDIWEKRLAFADLKLKFPMLNDKVDEELLVDKERPVKKPDTSYVTPGVCSRIYIYLTVIISRRVPLKLRPHDDPLPRPEVLLRPKERIAMIRDLVETTLAKQKDFDHHWEDQLDVGYFLYLTQSSRILIFIQNPYQASPIPYASRLFKYIPPLDASSRLSSNSSTTDDDPPSPSPSPRLARAVRMRYGRGGRIHLDRRNAIPPSLATSRLPRSTLFDVEEPMDVDDDQEGERGRQLGERWRFDSDDALPIGPDGSEEHDRTLIDDYATMYGLFLLSFFSFSLAHSLQAFEAYDDFVLRHRPCLFVDRSYSCYPRR